MDQILKLLFKANAGVWRGCSSAVQSGYRQRDSINTTLLIITLCSLLIQYILNQSKTSTDSNVVFKEAFKRLGAQRL